MILDYDKVAAITFGAAYVDVVDGYFCFHRFTREQELLYKERSADFYKKTFATSGVRLSFETNSERLFLKGTVTPGSSRAYYAADLFVNGVYSGSVNNFEGISLPKAYTTVKLSLDPFERSFDLGKGMKTVSLYLPWSVNMRIGEIALDDGADVNPVKPQKTLLAFGDSITHGYDALHPSNKYASKLAAFLNAQEYNKGIGAEVFWPELAKTRENFTPDCISVAYGTNDWKKCQRDVFENNCSGFIENLRNTYPLSRIFVISPIWRKDNDLERPCGPFESIEGFMRSVVDGIDNATLISGIDLVPHSEDFFSDLYLHPNDEGFSHYANGLKQVLNLE